MQNFNLKKILSAMKNSIMDSKVIIDFCGHKGDPDKLDAYLFSLVDDLAGGDEFPKEVSECNYCLDRLMKIQESVLAAEAKPIRPLKKVQFQLKKAEWTQKLRIQIRVLKESLELLTCPGFAQPALAPVMVRGGATEKPSHLYLNREFDDFNLEVYLNLEEDSTVSVELKLSEGDEAGHLPNRLRLMKEEKLFESLELDEAELSLDHLGLGSYDFEFLDGEDNMGSFSLDLN